MKGKLEGSCLCGQVTYSSTAEPAMIAVCHCSDCRKQSGGAFSVNVLIPAAELSIEGDSLEQYVKTGDSGKTVTRNFCRRCGSPISTELEAFDGLAAVKSGTLTDSSWVEPTVEIWCDDKQPWATVDESIPSMPRNPG